jgi:integrase
MKLNDVVVRTLSPPDHGQRTFYDDALPNFGIRVSQGGTRTFVVRHGHERHLVTIGRYPIISLSDARQLAREKLAEVVLGKKHTKAKRWNTALTEYLAHCKTKNRSGTVEEYERLINAHFAFGTRRLGDLEYEDFERRLKKLEDTPSERSHALTAVKVFLSWCVKPPRRYIAANPLAGLTAKKRPSRTRVLSDDELRWIWEACEQTGEQSPPVNEIVIEGTTGEAAVPPRLPAHFTTIVRLLILTGQRKGETAALKRAYFSHNEQTICLPSEITKNGREHTLPVGPMAVKILRQACEGQVGYLFPARRRSKCTNEPQPFNGFGKAKRDLDKLSGVTGWTLHDIRRTVRTNLSKLKVLPHISERILNHISSRGELEDTYDLYRFLPEMRDAMDLWEGHVRTVLTNDER